VTGGTESLLLHASCVAWRGGGVLITGPSGSGKSGLALQLMALGARLVADDQVLLRRDGCDVIAACPPALAGLIEARFVGILRADPQVETRVNLIVDLGQTETARLPQARTCDLLEKPLPLVYRAPGDHFPASLLWYLSFGRQD
jgi:HPr kinase/phosphorylase